MTKIYSMKNKHPERQPQKAISSGCSFQRYFSSSLLLVIYKRLVLTPASFHSIKLSRTEIFHSLSTARHVEALILRGNPPIRAGLHLVVCNHLTVSTEVTCYISGFDLNQTVSQISRDILGFAYGYLSARFYIVNCSIEFD